MRRFVLHRVGASLATGRARRQGLPIQPQEPFDRDGGLAALADPHDAGGLRDGLGRAAQGRPKEYQRYRRYEESKPALQDVDVIRRHFQDEGIVLDPQYDPSAAALLQAAALVNDGYWHGPYDPLPQVRIGRDEVLAWAQDKVTHATAGAEFIAERATEFGLPEEYSDRIADYYRNLAAKNEALVNAATPGLPDVQSAPLRSILWFQRAILSISLKLALSQQEWRSLDKATPPCFKMMER